MRSVECSRNGEIFHVSSGTFFILLFQQVIYFENMSFITRVARSSLRPTLAGLVGVALRL